MHCDRAQEFLSDYLEQTLDGTTAAGVEAHLSACAHCREELAALREVFHALAAVPEVEPPADGAWQVIRQLREERAARHEVQRSRTQRVSFVDWLRSLNPLGVAMGAGLATLIVGGSWLITGQPHQQLGMGANLGAAVRPALRDVTGPVVPSIQVGYGPASSATQQLEVRLTPNVDLPDAEIRITGSALPVQHVAKGSVNADASVVFQVQVPRQRSAEVLRVITQSQARQEQYAQLVVVPLTQPQPGELLFLRESETPAEEVLRKTSAGLGRPIIVDGVPNARITLTSEGSGRTLLDEVANRLGMTVREEKGAFRITPAP